jgi:undecaprenyl-diphosphatase
MLDRSTSSPDQGETSTGALLALLLAAATGAGAWQWLQVVALGVVEGLTEFLPVSSTGHLIVAADAMRFQGSIGGTFEIFIQLGAILAVFAYYLRDLYAQAAAVFGRGGERADTAGARRFWLDVLLAFLPAAAVGLALHGWIKASLFRPSVIGVTLILGGIAFLVVERLHTRAATTVSVLAISPRQAILVGLAQMLALIPGVSRSGASIVGGMLVGLDRPTATAFSFYLAIPTLGGATVVDLLKNLSALQGGDVGRLAVGTVVSGIVAWVSIGWLLRFVSRRSFVPFGIYRLVAGAAVLVLVAMGRL